MNKHYFIKLLHKYLKEELTIEEQQYVENYYNLFQNDPDVLEALSNEEKTAFKNDIKDAVWDNIARHEQSGQKIKYLKRSFTKYAAAAVIFAILITTCYFLLNKPLKKQAVDITSLPLKPDKKNRIIFLPDGSTVIVSSGSKLNYPSSFDGNKKREVFLDGQAFFDIKHDVSRPFIVHTGKLETIVLGTAFNIKAMPGETEITVTVTRGKVKVTDQDKTLGIITPNQQMTYNRKNIKSDIKIVDSNSYLDWKEQDLLFDNLTMAEAAKLLETKYKVTITIEDQSIISQRFTATFTKNSTLEQALESICLFNKVVYKYDKQKASVTISQ